MIDYLCLKLSWNTDQVLDNAHFDNERKFEFYNAIDDVERSRMLPAIPLGFDKNVTKKISGESKKAIRALNNLMRGPEKADKKTKGDNETFDMFGSREAAEKFLSDMKSGKLKMTHLFGK